MPAERYLIVFGNNVPIHVTPYKSSRVDHDEIEKQVDILLQACFVRPSLPPYAPPVILFGKKRRRQDTHKH